MMKFRGVYISLCIVLFSYLTVAQDYRYTLRNYKAVDGLPQSQVRTMLEDKNGYLWIGTEGGGLARFDGRNFKVYSTVDGLQSNIVTFLHLDAQQNLWIVHPRGITRFNGSTFKKFEQPGPRESATRLRRIFELRDTIFFISQPGHLGKIYKDSVFYWSEPLFPEQEDALITMARKTPEGSLLLVLNGNSVYNKTDEGTHRISIDEDIMRITNSLDYRGELWLNTNTGYFALDTRNKKLVRKQLPVKNYVVHYDHLNDVFWTYHDTKLLKEKVMKDRVLTDTIMRDTDFSQILVDSEGNTWIGTNGAGLLKYYVQDFDKVGPATLKNVMAIHIDETGAFWIGSSTNGLTKLVDGKVINYAKRDRGVKNAIYDITESPDGTLYVASAYGIGKYIRARDQFEWIRLHAEPWLNGALNIQFDENGRLWGTMFGGGIYCIDGTNKRQYTTAQGLSTNYPMASHYSARYKKFFVGDEFGLSAIVNDTTERITLRGIDNTSIIAIAAYRDSLLALSTGGGGVVMYNPRNGQLKSITTKDGLASDFIYFTAPDEQGILWIGSEKGITRVKVNAALDVVEHVHFDYENGLLGVETNQNAFLFQNGKKYFGLIDGLYVFNDPKLERGKIFNLHLTNVELLFGQHDITPYRDSTFSFFNIPYNLRLPPEENHITFHYNKVDKRYPKSIRFKYFLDGFDKTWSLPTSALHVTYSNLPPGKYNFKVMSTNSNGSWSLQVLEYPFVIKTPFYNTAAFYILIFIALAAVTALVLFIRVKQRIRHFMMLERFRVKEQENVRRDIARDFHDEMGNQLTRIINYVSLLRLGKEQNGRVNDELYDKVENSAKYLYSGTRDFIWSIDPGNDELSILFLHMRDFGVKLFEEKNISFRAFNDVKHKVKLPYGFSREANLIFKEAMTNCFKYSNAKNVTLSLKQRDNGSFCIVLEDDGVGFSHNPDEPSTGGIRNINERAQKLKARLELKTKPQNGTTITLHFTLTTATYGLTL